MRKPQVNEGLSAELYDDPPRFSTSHVDPYTWPVAARLLPDSQSLTSDHNPGDQEGQARRP
jgi:hypothetical protein